MIRHFRWFLVVLLALLVFLAPLPFGGATRTAFTGIQVACFLALAAAMLQARSLAFFQPVRMPVLALAAVGIFGFLQTVPLPMAMVDAISPAHGEIYRSAAALEGQEVQPRLSVAPSASRRTALSWLAIAALLAAAVVVGRHAVHRRVLAGALLAAAGFEILYGTRRWLGGLETIWGVAVPGGNDRLRGTFVNPDHFAVFLEIALAVAFALAAWGWHRARTSPSLDLKLLLVVPPLLLWSGLFAALAFTGSRAGLVAAFLGIVTQTLLVAAGSRRWRTLALGGGLGALGLVVVGSVGARYGFGRLLTTSPYEVAWSTRWQAIGATLDVWKEFLWTGSGLGTFRDIFPRMQPAGLEGTWLHSHSSPFEVGATVGVLGFSILLVGLVGLLPRLAHVYRDGWRTEDRLAAVAALGALTSVLAHEAVDFGLTMPANAVALVVVCGAATSARLAKRRKTAPSFRTIPEAES